MNPDTYKSSNRINYQASCVSNALGTIFMIHGSGGDHRKWDGLMERLPEGFNGIAVDLPGHGMSSLPLCSSIAEMAGFVRTVIKEINPARPLILAGHSLGTAVCLTIAIELAEDLDGIILIGGGSRLRVLPEVLNNLRDGNADPDFFRFGFSDQTPEEIKAREVAYYTEISYHILYADLNACDKFDVSGKLNRVKVPALIIVGEDDRLAPPKYSQYLQENITESKLKVIPGTGHFILLEKPDNVSQAIKEFCSGFKKD